ncbi:hypothetical protein [Paeniglutamicibacter cryotolerans]|uniref:Uncharacterized protein n=1 Tax=Paeniglutamicibacter cryotolerans TaxID=670079 RepID=A0A839QW30_9MICC|nr:hypothetical protein [Paeniglutamicibacter cryotolerans]MBB2997512.1 hypothetical protein [Paeniglutamicibacter cryotolerans]
MNTRASGIYGQIRELRDQLDALAREGRIVMGTDSLNDQHTETASAVSAALSGLDQAIEATCWMETMATLEGTYPEL